MASGKKALNLLNLKSAYMLDSTVVQARTYIDPWKADKQDVCTSDNHLPPLISGIFGVVPCSSHKIRPNFGEFSPTILAH